jgi:hypothetical protein
MILVALACAGPARQTARAAEPPAPAKQAKPAQPAAPAKPAVDPCAWKSLFDGKTLSGWKVLNFGGEGPVKVDQGLIVLGTGNSMTGIACTGDVPKSNYEIALEGKRISGGDFFCTTTFRVGDAPCSFVMGGWSGTVVGLSNVDNYDASENATTKFVDFKTGRWYRVLIRVSDAKIEAWIDDEQLVDQPRAEHKFSIRDECDLCQPLGICSWCTEGGVRNIRIRRLRPEEVAAAAADAKEKR